jgi:hypothetical protein
MLQLPIPYSVQESMGGPCLKKGDRKHDKGSVCQLLHGCSEILQRLADLVYTGLKLRPVGRH